MKISCLLLALAALSTSLLSHAGNSNYVEYGFGATKLHSVDSEDNKGLSGFSYGGGAKLLIAGQLDQSANVWFELGAAYSDGVKNGDTTISSKFLSTGLKFTTDPRKKLSSFMRIGGGKAFGITKTKGEANEKENTKQYYLGTGISFRLDIKRAVNFEIQRYGRDDADEGLNTFFVSFNQFI